MFHQPSELYFIFGHVSVPGNAVLYLCEAVIFRGIIQGCLQPLAALITAVVLLPFGAAFVILC
jgi:hypothetical protein